MLAYIVRRLLYAIPILIGVNLLTFALFFVVNTPDDMARMQLGVKRVTPEAIEKWKAERGYDKPLLWNAKASGSAAVTDTILFIHGEADRVTPAAAYLADLAAATAEITTRLAALAEAGRQEEPALVVELGGVGTQKHGPLPSTLSSTLRHITPRSTT